MSRRNQAPRRNILPDPKYGNEMLAKFVNMVMRSGKKSVAERIVYGALDRIAERSGQDDQHALELLSQALENIKPAVEVKSRRVGAARRRRCRCAWLMSLWMRPRTAVTPSRSVKTRTAWPKPTGLSRTTGGEMRLRRCHAQKDPSRAVSQYRHHGAHRCRQDHDD
jgi:small subunit ribosomal protein S7